MKTMEAKDYMSRREIANLFECLMTGLMYHRPDNYVDYMIDCLNKIKAVGIDTVRWDMFLEAKRAKTPLPPIAPTNGLSREASVAGSGRSEGDIRSSTPLPPIGSAVKEETEGGVVAMKSNVPLFIVIGGPGSSKGSFCETLIEHFPGLSHISTGGLLREKAGPEHQEAINAGELLPDDCVIPLLVDTIKTSCEHAKGILLTGFPRSKSQVSLLWDKIGDVQQVLLIDYEEEDLIFTLERRREEGGRPDDAEEASQRRVKIFKEQTLHVCKHFEDAGKLTLIDGSRNRELIVEEIAKILQNDFGEPTKVQVKFTSPRPPSVPRPKMKRPNQWEQETLEEEQEEDFEEYAGLKIRKLRLTTADEGRRDGLTTAPIVLLMGGPGSGRSVQAEKICSRYNYVHVNIDSCDGKADVVLQKVKDLGDDVAGVVLEGYPACEEHLNDFNSTIGGASLAILLDCYENVLRDRCLAQERQQPYVDEEITKFKEATLSVVRHYDLAEKLAIVLGDQPIDDVFAEVAAAIDSKVLHQDVTNSEDVQRTEQEPAAEGAEAQEAEVVPETATEEGAEETLKSLKVVFVIGGPGSGKGTQCEKILEHFQVGHVSTGDLMRAEVQSGSELGKKLKATMEKGELVTLDTVLQLLKASLVKMGKDKKCFLVDGFPREREQGVRFENEVTECSVCLFFDVPNDVMVQRLLHRGQTSGRVDDNEETIKARLKTFSDNTDPIIEYFKAKGKLAQIDATGTVDDIYKKVDKVLADAHVARK